MVPTTSRVPQTLGTAEPSGVMKGPVWQPLRVPEATGRLAETGSASQRHRSLPAKAAAGRGSIAEATRGRAPSGGTVPETGTGSNV